MVLNTKHIMSVSLVTNRSLTSAKAGNMGRVRLPLFMVCCRGNTPP